MSTVKEIEKKVIHIDSRINDNTSMLQIHGYEFNNLKEVNTKILGALEKLEQAITVLNSKVDIIPLSYINSNQFEKYKENNTDRLDNYDDRLTKIENNIKWFSAIIICAYGVLEFLFRFGIEKFFK